MIWFYERRADRLQYEIRRALDGPAFELVITHPDGRQDVERYADPDSLAERSSQLQRLLSSDGWEEPRPDRLKD